jgi:hypothetical protein
MATTSPFIFLVQPKFPMIQLEFLCSVKSNINQRLMHFYDREKEKFNVARVRLQKSTLMRRKCLQLCNNRYVR